MKKKVNPFAVLGVIVAIVGVAAAVWAFLNRRLSALRREEEGSDEEDLVEYLDDPASEVVPEE